MGMSEKWQPHTNRIKSNGFIHSLSLLFPIEMKFIHGLSIVYPESIIEMKLIDCSCIVYLIEHLSKWRSNVSNWLGFHCLSNVLLIVYPWFNPCFNRESPINRGFKRKITYLCMYSIYIYNIYTYLIYLYNIYSTHIAQISGPFIHGFTLCSPPASLGSKAWPATWPAAPAWPHPRSWMTRKHR